MCDNRASEEGMILELLSNTLDAGFGKIQRLARDAPIQQVPNEISKTTAIIEDSALEFNQLAQILNEQSTGMITEILLRKSRIRREVIPESFSLFRGPHYFVRLSQNARFAAQLRVYDAHVY
jgi:hypothetical protein